MKEAHHLQETARRLGVSAEVLEQYFALKAAEVAPRAKDAQDKQAKEALKSRRPRK